MGRRDSLASTVLNNLAREGLQGEGQGAGDVLVPLTKPICHL